MSDRHDIIRTAAAAAYNSAFEVIESGDEPLKGLELAAASLYLWREVGNDQNLAIGYWLYSRSLIAAESFDLAIEAAEKSLEHTSIISEAPDWLIASAFEGYARALKSAGDNRAKAAIAKAAELIDLIVDLEDRALIAGQFADLRD